MDGKDYEKLVSKKLCTTQEWTAEQFNWYRSEKLQMMHYNARSNDWTSCCIALSVFVFGILLFFISMGISKIK